MKMKQIYENKVKHPTGSDSMETLDEKNHSDVKHPTESNVKHPTESNVKHPTESNVKHPTELDVIFR
jgi:hypothetical protein